MKHIKRFIIFLFLITISLTIVNYNTRFFKEIGTNVPFIGRNYPKMAEGISTASDYINKTISHIPTPAEIIARIRNTEIPVKPDDVANNIHYSSNKLMNFYKDRNISVAIDNKTMDIYGTTNSSFDKYFVIRITDKDENVLKQATCSADAEGNFRRRITIPDGAYEVSVFTGEALYGEYSGYIAGYLYLEKAEDGALSIAKSPVYDNNLTRYEAPKSVSRALKNTYDICHKEESISTLAKILTENCTDNYEKAVIIHDWVTTNIFYDEDSLVEGSNTAPYVASDVLREKRAVCLGFANLYAALCRSAGLPCNIVTGYALGVGTNETEWNSDNMNNADANHVWNEVHIDDRWIIVDTTWDSKNKISGGVKTESRNISHLYFDSNLRFFSNNHKIMGYEG